MTTRTAINPSAWSINLGFDQAELVEGPRRMLFCSAQDAMDAESLNGLWLAMASDRRS